MTFRMGKSKKDKIKYGAKFGRGWWPKVTHFLWMD